MTERICSVPDCNGEVAALGCCDKHYRRKRKYGDPLLGPPERALQYPSTCTVGDCGRPHVARGYCRSHYNQLRATGSVTRRAPVSDAVPKGKYSEVMRPGHPLAHRRGGVALHRAVLYDSLGPGEHPCHWCGAPLRWDAPLYSPEKLQADHVDQDRSNNDVTNLVASCGPCNTSRSASTRRPA